jgi:hypothetical protein
VAKHNNNNDKKTSLYKVVRLMIDQCNRFFFSFFIYLFQISEDLQNMMMQINNNTRTYPGKRR